jgi:hypothetical protein
LRGVRWKVGGLHGRRLMRLVWFDLALGAAVSPGGYGFAVALVTLIAW